ncbi:MAG TPA: hypothetical protein VHP83_14090 [Aggregatilineaceae bacterium]|nr:hypothetical protein [Aggregatilineaceae bacterium]
MKQLLMRVAVVVWLMAAVCSSAPQTFAQDGTPSAAWANIVWFENCPASSGYGVAGIDYAYAAEPGYRFSYYIEWFSSTWGGGSSSGDYVYDTYETFSVYHKWAVAYDGYIMAHYDMYAPNGVLMSSTMFRADCTTGEVWTSYGDVYGINQPAADKRVMGTVLIDTPVYSEPSPTAALKPVLKAGQTWFIVGQTTGTDGELWYKVFVGSANTAYVPAATMAPQGAVPGAK